MKENRDSFFEALIGDGRALILVTAGALAFSGGIALFLSLRGEFLPHDVDYLGMRPEALCALNECRIVHFMIHDRASFGAVLISLATIYAWLALFPLRSGESWAWWLFVGSCLTGFGSFLCYLGYGYLDNWHGAATLLLLPVTGFGIWRTRHLARPFPGLRPGWKPERWNSLAGWGRIVWLACAAGLIGAGSTIMLVGMTEVFVPSDLEFIGYTREEMNTINPRLIPLIAHDRAGFGGGVMTTGLLIFGILWKAKPSRHVWQAITVAGACGFLIAVGVHYPIGYMDTGHLIPAWMGAVAFITGAALSWRRYGESPATASAGAVDRVRDGCQLGGQPLSREEAHRS